MERAAGRVFASGLFQGDPFIDDVDYVGPGEELVDELLGNTAGHGFIVQPNPIVSGPAPQRR